MAVENRRAVTVYLAAAIAMSGLSAVVLSGCGNQQAKPPVVTASPEQYQAQIGTGVANYKAYKAAHPHN